MWFYGLMAVGAFCAYRLFRKLAWEPGHVPRLIGYKRCDTCGKWHPQAKSWVAQSTLIYRLRSWSAWKPVKVHRHYHLHKTRACSRECLAAAYNALPPWPALVGFYTRVVPQEKHHAGI